MWEKVSQADKAREKERKKERDRAINLKFNVMHSCLLVSGAKQTQRPNA